MNKRQFKPVHEKRTQGYHEEVNKVNRAYQTWRKLLDLFAYFSVTSAYELLYRQSRQQTWTIKDWCHVEHRTICTSRLLDRTRAETLFPNKAHQSSSRRLLVQKSTTFTVNLAAVSLGKSLFHRGSFDWSRVMGHREEKERVPSSPPSWSTISASPLVQSEDMGLSHNSPSLQSNGHVKCPCSVF